MKRIDLGTMSGLVLLFLANIGWCQSPSASRNYVMETVVKTPSKKTMASLEGLPVDSANRNVSYFDGLGRPLQMVQWQGSPSKKDIVGHIEYDALGREVKKYLPYAEQNGSDGSFRTAAAGSQAAFYGTAGWDANVVKTSYPFSRSVLEASPLGRPLEQGAPGAVWQPYNVAVPGSGHTQKTLHGTNGTNEVGLWAVNGTGASTGGSYGANKLYRSITRDGNWASGKAGTLAEFRDMQDRVVLRRQWPTETDSLSTFYVYDDLGNLRYVVPPAVTAASFTESGTDFKNYIYAYRYDGRKRVVEKKVPGKGWEHMVYNRLDQLVLSQDSMQRAASQWAFTKYDALGRTVATGIYSSGAGLAAMQAAVDAHSATSPQSTLWENRTTSGIGYSNNAFPTAIAYYHGISYYDDYDFPGNLFGQPNGTTQVDGSRTRGLLTGTLTTVLGTGTMLLAVNYYDQDGRTIGTKGQHYLSGTADANNYDEVNNTYSFTGQVITTVRVHHTAAGNTTIANTYTYDHAGRKVSTKQNINSQGEVVLNKLEYNEIGQLKRKNLHSTNEGSSFLQATKYSYNERGWLKGSTSPEFSIRLGYDTLSSPQYNGNISAQLWGSGYGNRFDYQYDKLNRLLNGTSSGTVVMGEALTYDNMGNIASMARSDGSTTATGNYSYSGNQLAGISGGALATGNYAYDGNGNAVTDGRLGTTVAYNHLDLPVSFTKTGLSVAYTYDANGKKLKKVSSTMGTTNYVDGIVYKPDGSIDFIQTEEGIARNNSGTYSYEYNLADHLGNVRFSFKEHPTTHVLDPLQSDDYYAFGLRKVASAGPNNYLYNGKELQDELGQYDYGARFYDPVIGRWNSVDPLAEVSRRFSPYVYGNNNPIRFIDPDGMFSTDVTKNEDGTYKVVAAKADGDKKVYVQDAKGQRTGEVIGQTVTDRSFMNDNNKAVVGATINLSDKSGQGFLNNLMGDKKLGLGSYMANATGGGKYDFKTTGPNGEKNWMAGNVAKSDQAAYTYRGGTVDGVAGLSGGGGLPTIASARDIGNIGAGFVAGHDGMSWSDARLGFDALQSKQEGRIATEGQTTQKAQRVGYVLGLNMFSKENPIKSLFRPTPGMPVH